MEIAKFILTAIGTFVSVSALTFTVFQFWAKKREEKDKAFKDSISRELGAERDERKSAIDRLAKKIDALEQNIMDNLQQRMGRMEGELKGIRDTLGKIQQWFIDNTPAGGK
jgi:peptidoglycan hydrolase CwlO-like protein